MDEILFFGQQVFGHTAIALPSVGAAILRAGARDHVAAPAIVAHATPGDVIHNHTITHLEAAAARAGRHDLPRGLVSGDYTLVALRSLAQVFTIDRPNIRATNGGSLDGKKHLTVTRLRHRNFLQLNGAVPGEERRLHHLHCSISNAEPMRA